MPPSPPPLLPLLPLLLLLLLALPHRTHAAPLPCEGARGFLRAPNGTALLCDWDEHGWRYTLTPPMLRRAMAYTGSGAQLRALVAKLDAGQPIIYSAIGGSITRGHGAASMHARERYRGSFSALFFGYIARRWPRAAHTYVNGGVPATGSVHFAKCVHTYAHATSDLLTMDFAVNDFGGAEGTASAGEAIIRRLARSPHRDGNASAAAPAYVFVSWHADWAENAHRTAHRPQPGAWAPVFFDSPEEGANALAQYYDVAHASLRNALFAENAKGTVNFSYDNFQYHGNHPNARGHAMMADALVYALDAAAREEKAFPSSSPAEAWQLPARPLLAVNAGVEDATPLCYFGRALALLVRASRGWSYDELDAEKPGFIATGADPGAILELRLPPPPIAAAAASNALDDVAQVALAFLRAPDMTSITLSCARGCACDTQVVAGDGGAAGASTMEQHPFAVTHTARSANVSSKSEEGDDDVAEEEASSSSQQRRGRRRRHRACVLRVVSHGRFKVMGVVERRFAWTQLPYLKDTHATAFTADAAAEAEGRGGAE
jgi:hypothetical protein